MFFFQLCEPITPTIFQLCWLFWCCLEVHNVVTDKFLCEKGVKPMGKKVFSIFGFSSNSIP